MSRARPLGLDLGRWAPRRGRGAFALGSQPALAGTSGGRTSAAMAALMADEAILCFENTGREHPNTYDFVHELDQALGGRIVWLEFRKPPQKGMPLRHARVEVVSYETADRSGAPFEEMLEAVADYRATKGKPPLAPWARGRSCTSYLKNRTQRLYAARLGFRTWDTFVGLRADEPERVYRLGKARPGRETFRTPLFAEGITKPNILNFWKHQSFDLRVEEHEGNCTACFLKNKADLSRVLGQPETDADWWIRMGNLYPGFGGRRFPGYGQLLRERDSRLLVEEYLRKHGPDAWKHPDVARLNVGGLTPARFRLVVIQEKKNVQGLKAPFTCSCEAAMVGALEDDEDDEDDGDEDEDDPAPRVT